MRTLLAILFSLILVAMLAMSIAASMDRGLFEAGAELWPHLWFKATLLDAYLGFIIFYLWVAYKERRTTSRILWFILIMGLGNMAAAVYVLLQLYRMKPGESVEALLTRRAN
jgi:hypothetical protein